MSQDNPMEAPRLMCMLQSALLKVGTSISIKNEKLPDDTKRNVAHLKFSELHISRDDVDALLRRVPGWTQEAFFSDIGDPVVLLTLGLDYGEYSVTGFIRGSDAVLLTLMQAKLTNVEIALVRFGARLSGELQWLAAGDEVDNTEALLARECIADWSIYEPRSVLDSHRNIKPDGQTTIFDKIADAVVGGHELEDGTKVTIMRTKDEEAA